MIPLNPEPEVVSAKAADDVVVRTERDGERLATIEIDLAARTAGIHSLLTLPAMPVEFRPEPTLWFRAHVTFASADNDPELRVPFNLFVVTYRDGVQIAEERLRFFVGNEEAVVTFPLSIDRQGDQYQLVLYADHRLRGVLRVDQARLVQGLIEYWFGPNRHIAAPVDLSKRWYQRGSRVHCASYFGDHWAEMPAGWSLDAVHPAALEAAEWMLYAKIEHLYFGIDLPPAPARDVSQQRPPGPETMLSFSCGTDSTAALTLLPDTAYKYYVKRAYRTYLTALGARAEVPDHAIYEPSLARVPRLYLIDNTFELPRISAGQRHGFAHPFGYAAIGMLLADHINAGVLAFGSVMDQIFLRSGHLYTDVVKLPGSIYNANRQLLAGAGLFLALPTGGCSEMVTSRIANAGRFAGIAISCPRPVVGKLACGTCFKCFRKLRIDGVADVPAPDPSVDQVLAKYPLKSGTSVIYACQKGGYRHPVVDQYLDLDLAPLERYHDYALQHMMPEHLAEFARAQFAEFGVDPMSAADDLAVRLLGQRLWPEEFTYRRAGLPESTAEAIEFGT